MWHAVDMSGHPTNKETGDVLPLGRFGVNGLLSPIMALGWWRAATHSKEEERVWEKAVDDVLFVLKLL